MAITNSELKSNETVYNVLVDFAKKSSRKQDGEVYEEFAHSSATHVEQIGPGQFHVGVGAVAHDEDEAYRLAVNLVEAIVDVSAIGEIHILKGTVYGPEDNGKTEH